MGRQDPHEIQQREMHNPVLGTGWLESSFTGKDVGVLLDRLNMSQ